MNRAEAEHKDAMGVLEREQEQLDKRVEAERERWEKERQVLADNLRKAQR